MRRVKGEKWHRCCFCGGVASYCEVHDGYFCGVCDVWLEPPCGGGDCKYCVGRPLKPSEVRR